MERVPYSLAQVFRPAPSRETKSAVTVIYMPDDVPTTPSPPSAQPYVVPPDTEALRAAGMTNSQIREFLGGLLRDSYWRALLWFRSCAREWRNSADHPYEVDALRRMSLLADLCTGLLDAATHERVNSAVVFALSRPSLEAGIRCHWMMAGSTRSDTATPADDIRERYLGILDQDCRWMAKVSRVMDEGGIGGGRWATGGEELRAVLDGQPYSKGTSGASRFPTMPPVRNLLTDLGLLRLYHGYMIASEWVHGGRMASQEFGARGGAPVELSDVTLAFGQALWGMTLAAEAYTRRPGGEGWAFLSESPLHESHQIANYVWARLTEDEPKSESAT